MKKISLIHFLAICLFLVGFSYTSAANNGTMGGLVINNASDAYPQWLLDSWANQFTASVPNTTVNQISMTNQNLSSATNNLTNAFQQFPEGEPITVFLADHASDDGNYGNLGMRNSDFFKAVDAAGEATGHPVFLEDGGCWGSCRANPDPILFGGENGLKAYSAFTGQNSDTTMNTQTEPSRFLQGLASQKKDPADMTVSELNDFAKQNGYQLKFDGDPKYKPFSGQSINDKTCIILTPGPSKTYGLFVGSDPKGSDEYRTVPKEGLPDINCLKKHLQEEWIEPYEEDEQTNEPLRKEKLAPLYDDDLNAMKNCTTYYEDKQKEMSAKTRAEKSVTEGTIVGVEKPNKLQAIEFINSGFKGYTVKGGAKMQPGNSYHPRDKTVKDISEKNVKISSDCSFTPMADKELEDLKKPNSPFAGINGAGNQGGNNGSGSGGGGGGIGDALGKLLQGLLGKGNQGQSNGNQNNQQQQQPTPAPIAGTTTCPAIYQPVCGSDTRTYTNICELQKVSGVIISSEGACPDNVATGNLSSLSALLQHATQSGVPSSVLESAIRAVTNLITSMLSGGTTTTSTTTEVVVP